MKSFCILILAVLCSNGVWAKSESSTLSSITFTSSKPKSSAKVKRQWPYERPPNYSHYVGDAAVDAGRRNADANAQTINQVDLKDLNGNYNCAYETTNGIKVRQTSNMVGNDRVVVGYYSYIGQDNKIYTTHYTADRNGYRATGSHLPVHLSQAPSLVPGPASVQPLPFVTSKPRPDFASPTPFISSTPAPFISSTPSPFASSTPFSSSLPINDVPSPAPFTRLPFRYTPTAPSPVVSSSTPFASGVAPLTSPTRPNFPIYAPPTVPFPGYRYTNPRINPPYSVVSQQNPAPVFFAPTTDSPINRYPYAGAPSNAIASTLAPSLRSSDFNAIPSTISPLQNDIPVCFKEYIPPPPSTPTPFDIGFSNQPDTILITPKPSFSQTRLPNSLSVNQNLLPPYLSVGPLNNPPPRSQNFFRNNDDFINGPPIEFNNPVRPLPQSVVKDFSFRKRRDFDKN